MRLPAALLLAALFAGPSPAATLQRGPYLENMARESVTLRYRVDTASPAWITYGAAPDCERFLTPSPMGKEHNITLFGLLPDTTHCYRLYLPAEQSNAVYKAFEGEFVTFREEEKPYFSFLAFGDSGSGSEEQLQLAVQMSTFTPDFVLHTGDMLSEGLDETADEQYFKPYSSMLSRVPFFLTLGNHDYGNDLKTPEGRGFLRKNYIPFHTMPYTGRWPYYYYFDVAHARFIVLDTNDFFGAKEAPSLKPGSKQYKWLEYVLSRSKKKGWVFVVVHEPLYSTGAHGPLEEEVAALEPLLLKYNVDLVLQGHDHNYERTLPIKEGMIELSGGIPYITLGGGGSPLYIQRRNEDWSAKFLPVYHFAVFDVKEKHLSMKVYDRAGDIVDEWEIDKP